MIVRGARYCAFGAVPSLDPRRRVVARACFRFLVALRLGGLRPNDPDRRDHATRQRTVVAGLFIVAQTNSVTMIASWTWQNCSLSSGWRGVAASA